MPSAMNGNRTVQAPSPDVGSAPAPLGQISLAGQSEVLKQVLGVIEKKVRNMEKKKGKLDDYQARKNKGEHLNQDQLDALTKYQEIVNNLDFARELQKSFVTLGQDIQKAVKKTVRREQLLREEVEQKRLKNVLELQYLLDRLGDDSVRQELRQGVGGSPLLTEADLGSLDEFYKLVGPDRDQNVRWVSKVFQRWLTQYENASSHLWDLLEGRDKAVVGNNICPVTCGTTGQLSGACDDLDKALKESLDQVLLSGYFDQAPAHQNGVCEERETTPAQQQQEEEEEEDEEEEEEEEVVVVVVPAVAAAAAGVEPSVVQEQTAEPVVVMQQQQAVQQPPPPALPLESCCPPGAPNHRLPAQRPLGPERVVQDLMAQMQGTYNFMQELHAGSFEGPPLDPPRLGPPMKPPQIVEPAPDGLPRQTSMSLSEQPSTALPPASRTQVFQPVSKAPHSSGINVTAAPFSPCRPCSPQCPVPPASETEALNQASQYQNSYSQGFGNQSQHSVEASEMQSEQLQSEVGAFHSPDQSGSHQQASQQGAGFNRQGQSFYNSRGMSRGGPRNARGMMNGYRGSPNGFRGGYDNYRTPFSNTPNSGYGQTQFNTPRDYSNGNYQRDGYQQNYKRGAGQGTRGAPRASAQALRS
ncbi:hypothetical protein CRUP_022392 [Coryphaenoides rupestris]|nr:hypothetical protein CRUP_022392 [Coryphaenoides rupestris]